MDEKEKLITGIVLGAVVFFGLIIFAGKQVYDMITLSDNQKTYLPKVKEYADKWGLDPYIFAGLVNQESSYDPNAFRREAAYKYGTNPDFPEGGDASYGLCQLLYSTATGIGFVGAPSDLYDPDTNLDYGAKLLSSLYNRYGNYGDALAAYNSGQPISSAPSSTVDNYVPRIEQYASDFSSGNVFA